MTNNLGTKAFTLVELAIVVTIIGLLIGGVLKGQEILQDSRITSQVAQIRGYQAALLTFRSTYGALPGDMARPGEFVVNCSTSPCNVGGNGDGVITPFGTPLSAQNEWTPCHGNTMEGRTFWLQLATAGLISGIDTRGTWTGSPTSCGTWGIEAPVSAIDSNGGFHVASYRTATADHNFTGLYWPLQSSSVEAWTSGSTLLRPDVALKLDLKMDDGMPLTGNVLTFATNSCAKAVTKIYDVNYVSPGAQFKGCNLMINAMP